jgi:hypothetical protein
MKNLFNNISQDEKQRILEMHSGNKNVLSEQDSSVPSTNVMGTPNFQSKFGVKYSNVIPGDNTYAYARCEGIWFAHNLKTGKEWDLRKNPKWQSSIDMLNKKFPNANNCVSRIGKK